MYHWYKLCILYNTEAPFNSSVDISSLDHTVVIILKFLLIALMILAL